MIQFEKVFICLTEIFFLLIVENVSNFFHFFLSCLFIFLRVEVLFASRCCLLYFFSVLTWWRDKGRTPEIFVTERSRGNVKSLAVQTKKTKIFLYNFPSLFRLRLRCLYYFLDSKELSKKRKISAFFLLNLKLFSFSLSILLFQAA